MQVKIYLECATSDNYPHINASCCTPVVRDKSSSSEGPGFTYRGQGGTRDGMKLKDNISYYSDKPVTIDLSANQELAAAATAMISLYAQLATWHTVHGTLQPPHALHD